MSNRKIRKTHQDPVKKYPLRLEKIRRSSGMNQVEMAEYLEFETQVYRRIEGGGRAMTFDEAIYVSRKLKVPLDELIEDSAAIFIQEPENTISEALVDLVRRVPQHTAAPVLGILQAIVDEKK